MPKQKPMCVLLAISLLGQSATIKFSLQRIERSWPGSRCCCWRCARRLRWPDKHSLFVCSTVQRFAFQCTQPPLVVALPRLPSPGQRSQQRLQILTPGLEQAIAWLLLLPQPPGQSAHTSTARALLARSCARLCKR